MPWHHGLSACWLSFDGNELKSRTVKAFPNPPAKNCAFKGKVVGQQGTFLSADRNLEQDAMNNMRVQAANLGANFVHLTTNNAPGETAVTDTGNAYFCP